jgi:Nop14-like family
VQYKQSHFSCLQHFLLAIFFFCQIYCNKDFNMVAAGANPTREKGGSALKRLKNSLKTAGIIGQTSRASTSKKNKKRGNPSEVGKHDRAEKLNLIKGEMNPFEMKVTNTKFEVLGRKVKGAVGKPALTKQVGEDNVSNFYFGKLS